MRINRMKLPEDEEFFSSDEWKEYVTDGYEIDTNPPSKSSLFGTTPVKQSVYWKWAGKGKQPKVGNYYCITTFHSEGWKGEQQLIYTYHWILVGYATKLKPFQRDLTPEEEKIYNNWKKQMNEKRKREWDESQPKRNKEKQETEEKYEKLRLEEIKKKKDAIFKKDKDSVFNIVGKKAGNEAVSKFIEAREANAEISVEEFINKYYQRTGGGKRTRSKSKKSRKTRKTHLLSYF